MVRPNQILSRSGKELTFIMFARSESQVKRRVVALNFPGKYLMSGLSTDAVTNVEVISEGGVNRYAVTVDIERL